MEPRKRKILKHNNERWEVDFGLDSTGLKKRKVVATEAEADRERLMPTTRLSKIAASGGHD